MTNRPNCISDDRLQNANGKLAFVSLLLFTICHLPFAMPLAVAAPTANAPANGGGKSVTPDEMEVQIKGQFKGRLLIKKIVALSA